MAFCTEESPQIFCFEMNVHVPLARVKGFPFSFECDTGVAGRKGMPMAKAINLTLARLKEVLRRQDPPKWGLDYDPAIRAVREEAPSKSRFAQVWWERHGRYCHTLSSIEQKALLIALFNPALFEMQEQRMLATEARPHPLSGYEAAGGMNLPALRGTIDVCDRLDMIERHLWIHMEHPDGTGRVPVPAPFIGDLLLFLSDAQGPYCVNWTIKSTEEEFGRRLLASRPSRRPKEDAEAVRIRHAIEERYYADAGIPTIRVVDRDMPALFIQNIKDFILIQHRAAGFDAALYAEVCDRLQACIQTGQPPIMALGSMMRRYDLSLEIAKAACWRALWRRDVRPELMDEAIFPDLPLKPQRRYSLHAFSAWFARTQV